MSSAAKAISPRSLRVFLLGGFRTYVGERLVDESEWRLRKPKSLVKLLALAKGHWMHREQIMDLLWPELDPSAAANNLHKALHVARRALSPEPSSVGVYLALQDDMVTLQSPGALWIDVEAFEAEAAEAQRTRDPAAYDRAIELYTGDLLPEDIYEDWSVTRREELRAAYFSLLLESSELYEASQELSTAVARLKSLIAAEPSHEEAHARLMHLYARSGHRHQALKQYQQLCEAMRRDLDVDPAQPTQQLYQQILTGDYHVPVRVTSGGTSPSTPAEPSGTDGHVALVGRDDEVELLEDALETLFSGKGSLVFIGGEAGVGKSRLAHEIADRAGRRGGIVLKGAAYELEGQLPYGSFIEALEAYARNVSPAELREIVDRSSHEILRLMPGAAAALGIGQPGGGNRQVDRQRLFSAVAELLRSTSGEAPTLLVLDDLHAADEASLQLLHYLVRTNADVPLLVLCTFRIEEAGPATTLGQLIASCHREQIGSRLDLRRLSPRDSEILVGSLLAGEPVDRSVPDAVYNLAAGNPFYMHEAVRSLQETGVLERSAGRWRCSQEASMVPRPLADMVAARLERLGEMSCQALNALAAMGHEASYQVLRAASNLSEDQLLDALDDCMNRVLIEESPEGYRFSHPLYRDVLYQQLGRARRSVLHGRIAAAIETLYANRLEDYSETLAFHFARSGEPGRAVPYLITAGDHAAAVYANEAAISHYRGALELVDQPGSPEDASENTAGIKEKIGDHLLLMGQGSQAGEAYSESIHDLEARQRPLLSRLASPWRRSQSWDRGNAGNPVQTARLHRKAAYAFLSQHLSDPAEPHIAEAEELLSGESDEMERGRSLRVKAQWLWELGRHAEALGLAEDSLDIAEAHGDPIDIEAGYETLAIICHSLGEWKRGLHCELKYLGSRADSPQVAHVFDAHH